MIPDKSRTVPSYSYMIFNVYVYVAVTQKENFHLKRMRLMEVGPVQWLLSGPGVTGCKGTWTQAGFVPPTEKRCLCCATTCFRSVTGTQGSVRLWLSLRSKAHPNAVTEPSGPCASCSRVFTSPVKRGRCCQVKRAFQRLPRACGSGQRSSWGNRSLCTMFCGFIHLQYDLTNKYLCDPL